MAIFEAMPWHGGELSMHEKLHTPSDMDNPTVPMLSQQAARMLERAPLLAIGALDDQLRPWTSVWGGAPGFSRSLGQSVIGIRTSVASHSDPVVEALVGKRPDGQIVKEEGAGRMVSGLTFDLATRKRVKLYGRMIAGALKSIDLDGHNGELESEIQLVVHVEQSLGNCPKYAATKDITPAKVQSRLLSDSSILTEEAMEVIRNSDMFFISSRHHLDDMDTNYRGGPRSFTRVTSDEISTTIIWPEYSGNRLYQTLGNLQATPLAGLCFPDFATGSVLYVTGTTEILVGSSAASLLPHSNLAVKLTVSAARLVAQGLPFRGTAGAPSPYNPPVRYLASEKPAAARVMAQAAYTARLVGQTRLTPSISRFHFSLDKVAVIRPGQYVTFDFSSHLDAGYSHMRDEDPRSINDDFIRTFTVSGASTTTRIPASESRVTAEFEITIRKVGPATEFLFKHGLSQSDRGSALVITVTGFGGEFSVEQRDGETIGFMAAGVGITPLLPALSDLDPVRLVVLWALRRSDMGLAADVLAQYPHAAKSMRIFLTGSVDSADRSSADENILADAGAAVSHGRFTAGDFAGDGFDDIKRWYMCAHPVVREQVSSWLPDKEVIYEDFNF